MCDNTDCKNPIFKATTYMTVLIAEFNFDTCFWCRDCISRDKKMVYMDNIK